MSVSDNVDNAGMLTAASNSELYSVRRDAMRKKLRLSSILHQKVPDHAEPSCGLRNEFCSGGSVLPVFVCCGDW
jgi:hypothetical protein